MRVKFRELFDLNEDGTLSPKGNLIFGGRRMSAKTIIRKGNTFDGMDVNVFYGHDLEIEDIGDAFEVKMVYFK
ncbi:MAG: hypothetical protein KDC45_06145 [Bacteroidetes bacterium]|nr:hypothetical protein [Bacteroidota bacterium]